MTGQLVGFTTRERLAMLWSADAVRRRRREYVALSLAWIGIGTAQGFHSRRASLMGIGQLAVGLMFAVRAFQLRSRAAESFSEREIASAERESVRCPRCRERVLTLETRCVHCGSRSFQFAFSSDGRGIALLVTVAAVLAFVAYWLAWL